MRVLITPFTPLMTCYLTDDADVAEIEKGFTTGRVHSMQTLPRQCHHQL